MRAWGRDQPRLHNRDDPVPTYIVGLTTHAHALMFHKLCLSPGSGSYELLVTHSYGSFGVAGLGGSFDPGPLSPV